jgi:rhodanese-related sulfurtransferase
VPGVEVTLIAQALEQKGVPVVVHCAGRTRSILACQTLRDLGLNDVYALKNGTMGWTLAGFELAKETEAAFEASSPAARTEGARRARKLAEQQGVEYIDAAQLAQWLAKATAGEMNCYAFDARLADAYTAGHIPGSKTLPGGQAFLFADDNAAVRRAPIVFIDDEEAQASMAAYWFRRLGYPRVCVLAGGIAAWQKHTGAVLETGRGRVAPLQLEEMRTQTQQIGAAALSARIAAEPELRVLDVNTSKNFAAGHIRGARWVSRGWLEPRAEELLPGKQQPVAVVCQNGVQSAYAGATLRALGYESVSVLAGGLAAWKKAGLALETGAPAAGAGSADVVKNPYERTKEDMVKYLHWEEQLAEKPGNPAKSKA